MLQFSQKCSIQGTEKDKIKKFSPNIGMFEQFRNLFSSTTLDLVQIKLGVVDFRIIFYET